jgi:hypothetical protein
MGVSPAQKKLKIFDVSLPIQIHHGFPETSQLHTINFPENVLRFIPWYTESFYSSSAFYTQYGGIDSVCVRVYVRVQRECMKKFGGSSCRTVLLPRMKYKRTERYLIIY